MKSPKIEESSEQKAERKRAEAQKARAIQQGVQDQTTIFQRLRNPRASLFSGQIRRKRPIV